jgi:hypothetical protein
MSRTRAKFWFRLPSLVAAGIPKTFIGRLIVMRKIKVVLDEWCARVGIIANAIPTYPWIQQGNRQQKDSEQAQFESVLLASEFEIQVKLYPLQNAHRKMSLISQQQH